MIERLEEESSRKIGGMGGREGWYGIGGMVEEDGMRESWRRVFKKMEGWKDSSKKNGRLGRWEREWGMGGHGRMDDGCIQEDVEEERFSTEDS
jgi:hypothetical protein